MKSKFSKEEKVQLYKLLDLIENDDKAAYFIIDVDWKADPSLSHYPKIIKKPMSLTKVRNKIKLSKYQYLEEIFNDIQLIWTNCKKFNLETSVNF